MLYGVSKFRFSIIFVACQSVALFASREKLFHEIKAANLDKVKAIIQKNPNLINESDREGNTALMYAKKIKDSKPRQEIIAYLEGVAKKSFGSLVTTGGSAALPSIGNPGLMQQHSEMWDDARESLVEEKERLLQAAYEAEFANLVAEAVERDEIQKIMEQERYGIKKREQEKAKAGVKKNNDRRTSTSETSENDKNMSVAALELLA